MGRVIDYALVRNCRARAAALGRRGSDHAVVALTVRIGRKTYRIALWNVQRDRPGHEVRQHLLELLQEYDILLLVETDQYKATLRSLESRGHTVVVFDIEPGQANTAIVVHADHDTSRHYCRRMTRTGWFTVRGGRTPPKWLPTLVVDDLLRVAIGHPAPSVRSVPRSRLGRIVHQLIGPARRVLSTRSWMRSARTFMLNRAPHQALVVAADMNQTPDARGRHTPHWLAQETGARIVAPAQPTHGH